MLPLLALGGSARAPGQAHLVAGLPGSACPKLGSPETRRLAWSLLPSRRLMVSPALTRRVPVTGLPVLSAPAERASRSGSCTCGRVPRRPAARRGLKRASLCRPGSARSIHASVASRAAASMGASLTHGIELAADGIGIRRAGDAQRREPPARDDDAQLPRLTSWSGTLATLKGWPAAARAAVDLRSPWPAQPGAERPAQLQAERVWRSAALSISAGP